jgi:hypothetical protein
MLGAGVAVDHDPQRLAGHLGVAHRQLAVVGLRVPEPTVTAPHPARSRCPSARASAEVIHLLDPSAAAIRPASEAAHLRTGVRWPRRRRLRLGNHKVGPAMVTALEGLRSCAL